MPQNGRDDICEVYCIHKEAVQKGKDNMLDRNTVQGLAETFKLLGDPTRVQIIYTLLNGEHCVCDLAAVLGMTQSAVSHQLRLLRGARLVKFRKEGKIAYYSIDDHHIAGLFSEGLDHVTHD